ncbi:MAG: hypothetical protein ACI9TI_000182 [Natronomonas sp.]|jgi:hypothetical protein
MSPGAEHERMAESERVSVQTYVPSTQRERWREEADELDMSNAEYVRTMVQAGRRSFDLYTTDDGPDGDVSDPTPGVNGLEERVLDVLREDEFADWDRLLAGVTDDIEDRLEAALDELQAAGRVKYSGRHGGYTVIDDEH